jgi:hypothetical protein|tara:strand:+ start:597 stop:866 length:270 start_codon:yes stop_codon:yes gene_type:complete
MSWSVLDALTTDKEKTMSCINIAGSKATQARINRAHEIAETKALLDMFQEQQAEARACGYEFPTFSEYCQSSGERYDAALYRAAVAIRD